MLKSILEKTENAIGAISRGKQVVVAGDIHQLPPTSFFASTNTRKHGWKRRGDFLWRKGQVKAEPRVAGDAEKTRSLDLIAPEELSAAMLVVIDKSYGLEKDGLFRVIAREYGVGRVTVAATACLENALNLLLKEKKVKSIEGKLSLC